MPSTNYGLKDALQIDGSPVFQSFLRFVVPDTGNPIESTKLTLWVTNGSNQGGDVYLTDASWSETSVTWLNRPAPTTSRGPDRRGCLSTAHDRRGRRR